MQIPLASHDGATLERPVVRALVQTGATETQYHRAGRGDAVLLVLSTGIDTPFGRALFDELAAHFRVVAPQPPAGAPPLAVSRWLRELIDGLGLARPVIVADEAAGVAALGFWLHDAHRVRALVAIRHDHPDPELPADSEAMRDSELLVVRLDPAATTAGSARAAADAVHAFVQAREAAGPPVPWAGA